MSWQFPEYRIGETLDWEKLHRSYSWISDMEAVPQDARWHGEGDVLTHTRMVVERLTGLAEFQTLSQQDKHILVTAALLHDVEKRSTTVEEEINGKFRVVSPRHARKGELTARTILYRDFGVPFTVREAICKLVRLHGLPIWAITKDDPAYAVIRASLGVNTRHLALLAEADVRGRITDDVEEMLLRIEFFRELCREEQCYGKRRAFTTNYARYWYIRKGGSPNYVPYNDAICWVTLLCALPGAGKDTYIRQHLDQPVLSLDNIRRQQGISPTDKKRNGTVVQLAKEQARVYLRQKTSFVFNATNITTDRRKRWIDLFTSYGAAVRIVYLEVPYRELLRQNAGREHRVPRVVVDGLIEKLEVPSVGEAWEVEYFVS